MIHGVIKKPRFVPGVKSSPVSWSPRPRPGQSTTNAFETMATGSSLSNSNSGGSAVVGNPMSRNSSGSKRSRRRRQQQRLHDEHRGVRLLLLSVAILATLFYSWDDADATNNEGGEAWEENARRKQEWEEGLPQIQKSERRNKRNVQHNTGKVSSAAVGAPSPQRQSAIHTARIDTVIRYLTSLAQLPPSKLWNILGMHDANSYGDDPFSLSALETGNCPWSAEGSDVTTVDWLISRPYNSEDIARTYRNNIERLRNVARPRREMEEYDAENEVAIWYEQ